MAEAAKAPVPRSVPHDGMPPADHRRRAALVVCALVASVAYVALALAVGAGLTRHWDEVVRDFFRPGDRWGPTQMRVDMLVEGLEPWRVLVVLVTATALVTVLRHSWRPVMIVTAVAVPPAAVAFTTKFLLARPDPHDEVSALGGAFPSGHTLTLLVTGGLLLRLWGPSSPWVKRAGWAVVGLVTAAMALSLLLQAAHWLTDVLAGALLGGAALAATAAIPQPGSEPLADAGRHQRTGAPASISLESRTSRRPSSSS